MKTFQPLDIILAIRWVAHLSTHFLVDADNVTQYSVDKNRSKGLGRQVFLPAESDRGVAAFWTWLDKYGGGGPPNSLLSRPIDPSAPPPLRRVLLDRYEQHTKHCKSCLGAMKGFQTAYNLFFLVACVMAVSAVSLFTIAAVVSSPSGLPHAYAQLTISSLGSTVTQMSSTSWLASVLAACSALSFVLCRFCSGMVQKFLFVGYDKHHKSKGS